MWISTNVKQASMNYYDERKLDKIYLHRANKPLPHSFWIIKLKIHQKANNIVAWAAQIGVRVV